MGSVPGLHSLAAQISSVMSRLTILSSDPVGGNTLNPNYEICLNNATYGPSSKLSPGPLEIEQAF